MRYLGDSLVPLAELSCSLGKRPLPRAPGRAPSSPGALLTLSPKEGGAGVSLLILICISLKLEVEDFIPLPAPVWLVSDPRPRSLEDLRAQEGRWAGPGCTRRGWAAPHLPWSLQRPLARIYLLVGLLGLCLASWTAALPHIPFPPILRTPAVCGSPAQGHFLPHSFPPPAPLGEWGGCGGEFICFIAIWKSFKCRNSFSWLLIFPSWM